MRIYCTVKVQNQIGSNNTQDTQRRFIGEAGDGSNDGYTSEEIDYTVKRARANEIMETDNEEKGTSIGRVIEDLEMPIKNRDRSIKGDTGQCDLTGHERWLSQTAESMQELQSQETVSGQYEDRDGASMQKHRRAEAVRLDTCIAEYNKGTTDRSAELAQLWLKLDPHGELGHPTDHDWNMKNSQNVKITRNTLGELPRRLQQSQQQEPIVPELGGVIAQSL